MRLDGQVILDYADAYQRVTSYQDFGFGGRNGSDNDARYISDLLVTKLGTNTSQYDINLPNAPLANDLYWDNTSTGTVGTSNFETGTADGGDLGVNTADPNANLEVDGSGNFQHSMEPEQRVKATVQLAVQRRPVPRCTQRRARLTRNGWVTISRLRTVIPKRLRRSLVLQLRLYPEQNWTQRH